MTTHGSLLLRILALVSFLLACIAALRDSPLFDHDAVLLPLGLALWVGSTLVG